MARIKSCLAKVRGNEGTVESYGLLDLTPYGHQMEWEDSPSGWTQADVWLKFVGELDEVQKQCSNLIGGEVERCLANRDLGSLSLWSLV